LNLKGRPNLLQCCKQFATALTSTQVALCCLGALTQRWTPQTCYMLLHNTANIMKGVYFL